MNNQTAELFEAGSSRVKPKKSKFLNKVKSNYLQSIKGNHIDYNKIRIARDDVERKLMFKDMPIIAQGAFNPDQVLTKGEIEEWHKHNLLPEDVNNTAALSHRMAVLDQRLQPEYIMADRRKQSYKRFRQSQSQMTNLKGFKHWNKDEASKMHD